MVSQNKLQRRQKPPRLLLLPQIQDEMGTTEMAAALMACLFSPLAISRGWGKSSPSPKGWLVDAVLQSPWKQGEEPVSNAKPRCLQQLQEQPYWCGISTAATGPLHKNTAPLELPPRPKNPAATVCLLLLLQHSQWGRPWHGQVSGC